MDQRTASAEMASALEYVHPGRLFVAWGVIVHI